MKRGLTIDFFSSNGGDGPKTGVRLRHDSGRTIKVAHSPRKVVNQEIAFALMDLWVKYDFVPDVGDEHLMYSSGPFITKVAD